MTSNADNDQRPLGQSGIQVTGVALGCWPIAGVTTLGANEQDSIATVREAIDCGVNFLDTAYVYGPEGESERVIAKALNGRRDDVVIATKGGIHYEDGQMTQDARPATLRAECEESLRRLDRERVELLYLHSPDPSVPIEESAGALGELQREGKTRSVGASNCSLEQLQAFHAVCPLAAVQLPYNLLQRDIEKRTLPWCREHGIAITAYWPLMKGLLAGKLPPSGELDPNDNRLSYPMYQGEEWVKNQAFVERLREAAALTDATVAQVVINWTMHQPGITSVLCGAKRAWQIRETAGAMGWSLTGEQQQIIERALAARGEAAAKRTYE
ncbi:General stress protein 69 [Posidoniimonas polymericola]|uniref:General stress protein 69 n=1 Tax=Posidoniimonas polymericola TaxID=2528002 RepID=A0A5C5YQ22_9BACT|nr:aldo/keto reductase [Posidoniimonas polymericola]TWT77005.1 General stress protein 69 [Posidoniimonas polymericola]